LTDLNGDITHFVAVKEDITEKKALFEELVLTKEKAQESDRLKTAFLNNISHEIRTPFNGILGFLSLISAQDISITERDLYIGIINQSADRLINTINDIVEISTIQAGQTKVYIAETNINKLVDKLYYKFDPFAETKGLELIIKKTLSDADCFVKTDETKLLAILNNLINNAIKFTKKGSVEIGYSLHNDILRFYVKDTGIGIPEEKCQSIFERFMQADVSNTRGFEGSGLGLSIAKAYVEMLEGTIWLESKVGIGSKFFLQIPCQTNDDIKPESVAEKPDNLQNSGENLTILFAEDDDINFDFTNVILSRADYKVLRAKTGAEAIQLCRNNPHVSLILMDIKMPGINGYIATKEIRLFNQDIPIIAVTAYAQPGDEQRALDAGCTYYLAKPVRRHELLNLVNSYLKK
jgi:CheY-like chemotaxis protein